MLFFFRKHLTDPKTRITFASAYEKSMFKKINGSKKSANFFEFFSAKNKVL